MAGHGEKFSRKQEEAIIALMTTTSIAAAADKVGISQTALFRWLQNDEFQQKYKEARSAALSQAIAQLQQATGEAVQTLRVGRRWRSGFIACIGSS